MFKLENKIYLKIKKNNKKLQKVDFLEGFRPLRKNEVANHLLTKSRGWADGRKSILWIAYSKNRSRPQSGYFSMLKICYLSL
jgi:hypothetical protein